MSISHAILQQELHEDALKGFETLIRLNREGNQSINNANSLRRLIALFILNIYESSYTTGNEEDEAFKALRSNEKPKNRNRLAACLARLLAEDNTSWMLENPWRQPIVSLFDAELIEIFREKKVESGLMAHEKLQKLREIVVGSESQLTLALSALTGLSHSNNQRGRLLKALRNRTAGLLIVPFLPAEFEALLGEAYKRTDSYLEMRNEFGIVDARNDARIELSRIVKIFEAQLTYYSQLICEKSVRRLIDLIDDDFADNPAAKPGRIIIDTRDSKKYPLHLLGHNMNVGFVVRNDGVGHAYDTRLNVIGDDSVSLSSSEIALDRIAPGGAHVVEIPAKIGAAVPNVDLLIEMSWRNFDDSAQRAEAMFSLKAQRADINWDSLTQYEPYSLEPVDDEEDLVGRKDLLNKLLAAFKAQRVGSAVIRGQKRVGKTSLARAVQSNLEKSGYVVMFLEAGDYVRADPAQTVTHLGASLCKRLRFLQPKISGVQVPLFDDGLAPLADYLDEINLILSSEKIVFILDEFDELPLDLYARGAVGDSFFLSLRSISSRSNIGFLIVGGEKLAHVLDCQGDKLNKWKVFEVDYFTRESDWSDFKELVQRPTHDILEFTDNALFALHMASAGNPYYTNLICNEVFQQAVKRRDCHVTNTELTVAIEATVREAGQNAFQHFWEDGIFERGPQAADKSIRRRRILITISDVLASHPKATKSLIEAHPLANRIPTLESDLKEFVTRKLLGHVHTDDSYYFKVPLFASWLRGRGIENVIATLSDLDAALLERQKEEELRVRHEELNSLVSAWGSYRGQIITEDRVKAWLDQFGGVRDQRIMFNLLKGVRFYSNQFLRTKMVEIHDVIKRGLIHTIDSKKFKRSDICVSYLDNPAKSGADLARLYVDEASIYVDNVFEKGRLQQMLEEKTDIKALLFLDDYVGTGETAINYLRDVDIAVWEVVAERNIKVVFASVTAFTGGWRKLEEAVKSLKMSVTLHLCEGLDESQQCFSNTSAIFQDTQERDEAKKIVMHFGQRLEKNCPLGYGNLEMAVVFERRCPNNTLPILWSESVNPRWIPLFKRL